ncbi:hypothetical protein M3J09_009210 [Ascochyta lentis]
MAYRSKPRYTLYGSGVSCAKSFKRQKSDESWLVANSLNAADWEGRHLLHRFWPKVCWSRPSSMQESVHAPIDYQSARHPCVRIPAVFLYTYLLASPWTNRRSCLFRGTEAVLNGHVRRALLLSSYLPISFPFCNRASASHLQGPFRNTVVFVSLGCLTTVVLE